MAMTQPVLCHCNLLEPDSVGASTLRLPSLVNLSGAVEEQMFVLTMDGSLCEVAVTQGLFFCNTSKELHELLLWI